MLVLLKLLLVKGGGKHGKAAAHHDRDDGEHDAHFEQREALCERLTTR